jgi:hypothetical protein
MPCMPGYAGWKKVLDILFISKKYIKYNFSSPAFGRAYIYNLVIRVLATNNLKILGKIIVETKYNNILIANIPKVNKLRK